MEEEPVKAASPPKRTDDHVHKHFVLEAEKLEIEDAVCGGSTGSPGIRP